MLAGAAGVALRLQARFGEELRHGQRRQLHAQDTMALRSQPVHVQRLAAQRYQHACRMWQLQCGPVLLQQRHDLVLMKACLSVVPALQPEVCIHGLVVLVQPGVVPRLR